MNNSKNWIPWQGSVDHPSTGPVNFRAVIQPRINPPHVSADSPRHMAPGARAEVIYYDLYDDDGQEFPHPCMVADDEAVRELILRDYLRRKDADDMVLSVVADRLREVVA